MFFVSITRLRLRSAWYLLSFLIKANRSARQMQMHPGFIRGKTLMDRHLTFWTMSLWNSETQMHAFRNNGAHKKAMGRLQHWCDEASMVHWLQEDQDLPLWQTACTRMKMEGKASKVKHPSPQHLKLEFPDPRLSSGTERILLPKSQA